MKIHYNLKKKDPLSNIRDKHQVKIYIKLAKPFTGGINPKNEIKSNKRTRRKRKINALIDNSKILGASTRFENFLDSKRSIIKLYNTDNYCLVRAVIISILYIEDRKKYNYYLENETEFEEEVYDVVNKLEISNLPAGYNEYIKLENYYDDYQIMIIDEYYGNIDDAIYLNKEKKFKKFVYLLL